MPPRDHERVARRGRSFWEEGDTLGRFVDDNRLALATRDAAEGTSGLQSRVGGQSYGLFSVSRQKLLLMSMASSTQSAMLSEMC
jgi:hypothetical protein